MKGTMPVESRYLNGVGTNYDPKAVILKMKVVLCLLAFVSASIFGLASTNNSEIDADSHPSGVRIVGVCDPEPGQRMRCWDMGGRVDAQLGLAVASELKNLSTPSPVVLHFRKKNRLLVLEGPRTVLTRVGNVVPIPPRQRVHARAQQPAPSYAWCFISIHAEKSDHRVNHLLPYLEQLVSSERIPAEIGAQATFGVVPIKILSVTKSAPNELAHLGFKSSWLIAFEIPHDSADSRFVLEVQALDRSGQPIYFADAEGVPVPVNLAEDFPFGLDNDIGAFFPKNLIFSARERGRVWMTFINPELMGSVRVSLAKWNDISLRNIPLDPSPEPAIKPGSYEQPHAR